VIATHEQCPIGTPPPNNKELKDVVNTPDCTVSTVTTDHESRMQSFSFDDATWSWVAGDWSEWTIDSSSSVPATSVECPGPKPDKIVSIAHHTNQKCGDDFSTTTTETTSTDFTLDVATGIWTPGTPAVVTTSVNTPATVVACVTKPDKHVTPAVFVKATLPNTGAPSLLGGFAGILLLITGFFIVRSQRRTAADD
jgi:LPXTG-motif cell wall-anchored protein